MSMKHCREELLLFQAVPILFWNVPLEMLAFCL